MTDSAKKLIPMLDLGPEIAELREELLTAFTRVLDSKQFALGPELQAFEQEAAEWLGAKHAIGVNSGTDALIISLRALGIGKGDEVITTPFTFFATASSIRHTGATPVFVDIEYDSFNINPELIEEAITPRTRAIMPVHLYGRPANMHRIMEIAEAHDLFVVEDAAQSFGARDHSYPEPRMTGTIGHLGAFSFYPTKNLGTYGDGGMITTNDDELALLARKLRNHGSLIPYENEMLGYNSRLDEIQAAILRVKLPHVNKWNEQRRQLAQEYPRKLAHIPGLEWPEVVPGHVFHQITVRVEGEREEMIQRLEQEGMQTRIYYPKLVSSLMAAATDEPTQPESALPVAAAAAASVLSVPVDISAV